MTEAVAARGLGAVEAIARGALKRAAAIWFVTAIAGQWLFAYYIAGSYGPTLVSGDFQAWSRNTGLEDGYIAGDIVGNLFFAAHVAFAAVLTFGGALQLVPQIRNRFIAFHRWNGRLFLITAIAAASGALYLKWVRGELQGGGSESTGIVESIAITLDAILILTFAGLAWRAVRGRNIAAHQRWATRLFLVVNGVWFMRVGMKAWMLLTGLDAQHFFKFWSLGAILVPLIVYQLYLRAQTAAPPAQFAMAGSLVALTLIMGIGAVAAFLDWWRPLLLL